MSDSEATRSDAGTDDEAMEVSLHGAGPAAGQHQQMSRSRATSPSASAPSDSAAAAGMDDAYGCRLTARQRARLEKEAGIAEDVAWHEMDLLPNLTYTWKGKGTKTAGQMTEEEWLKRQEALERRRMRSLRDKREAEEAVKAKIRRAVTARFRGKLGGDSGIDGQGGGGDEQDGGSTRPGWVKMRYTAQGVTVAWHPAAHPLSLPVPVAAPPNGSMEPVELDLQPLEQEGGGAWQVPPASSSSFKPGSVLLLQQHAAGQLLHCIDSQSWTVGCLLQQQVVDALQDAGYDQHQPSEGILMPDWQQWRAVVKTVRRNGSQLSGVVVRLVQQGDAPFL